MSDNTNTPDKDSTLSEWRGAVERFDEATAKMDAQSEKSEARDGEYKTLKKSLTDEVEKSHSKIKELEVTLAKARHVETAPNELLEKGYEIYMKETGLHAENVISFDDFRNYKRAIDAVQMTASAQDKAVRLGVMTADQVALSKSIVSQSSMAQKGVALAMPAHAAMIEHIAWKMNPIKQYAHVGKRPTKTYERIISLRNDDVTWGNDLSTPNAMGDASATFEESTTTARLVFRTEKVGIEAAGDSTFSMDEYLTTDNYAAINQSMGDRFVNGNGSTEPQGLWTATTIAKSVARDRDNYTHFVAINSGTAGEVTFDSLSQMMAQLRDEGPLYSMDARFYGNATTLAAIRNLKDNQDHPIVRDEVVQDGLRTTVRGREYIILEGAPDISAAQVANSATGSPLFYGDMRKAYTVFDRVSLGMTPFSNHSWPAPTVWFFARVGGSIFDGRSGIFLNPAA